MWAGSHFKATTSGAELEQPSESRQGWLKINSAARVGPDSCARTANMDAHQVLLAGRSGGSR